MNNTIVGLEAPKLRKYQIVDVNHNNKVVFEGTYGQCDLEWAKLRWKITEAGCHIRYFYKMVETDEFITL